MDLKCKVGCGSHKPATHSKSESDAADGSVLFAGLTVAENKDFRRIGQTKVGELSNDDFELYLRLAEKMMP